MLEVLFFLTSNSGYSLMWKSDASYIGSDGITLRELEGSKVSSSQQLAPEVTSSSLSCVFCVFLRYLSRAFILAEMLGKYFCFFWCWGSSRDLLLLKTRGVSCIASVQMKLWTRKLWYQWHINDNLVPSKTIGGIKITDDFNKSLTYW